jgi:peroxiredoxin
MMRLIIVLLLSLTAPLNFAANSQTIEGTAPNFTLKSDSGKNIRLSEYRGQVVLVNFWASWCGPCRQEMPALNALQKKYEKLGFTVMGVNLDQNPDDAQKVLRDIPVDFPILYDNENVVSESYDVDAMPTTVLIDRDGNMRYLHRGYKAGYEDSYENQIKTLVRE